MFQVLFVTWFLERVNVLPASPLCQFCALCMWITCCINVFHEFIPLWLGLVNTNVHTPNLTSNSHKPPNTSTQYVPVYTQSFLGPVKVFTYWSGWILKSKNDMTYTHSSAVVSFLCKDNATHMTCYQYNHEERQQWRCLGECLTCKMFSWEMRFCTKCGNDVSKRKLLSVAHANSRWRF